jgi:hypothetical protein
VRLLVVSPWSAEARAVVSEGGDRDRSEPSRTRDNWYSIQNTVNLLYRGKTQ